MSTAPRNVRRMCPLRNAAFTLVELLVVIGIVGLLLAIMIPSLAGAKERSRRVVCQSNLHQFCIGLNAYAGSNNQALPRGRAEPGGEHTPLVSTKTRKQLLKYVGSPKVLECPWLGSPFKNTGGWYYPGQGWVLGYNYLGGHEGTPWDAPEGFATWKSPQKVTELPTFPVLTELNAWSIAERRTWAPHGKRGPITEFGDEGKGGMTAKEAGAAGGNSCLIDGSVSWKNIEKMKHYLGSDGGRTACCTMW